MCKYTRLKKVKLNELAQAFYETFQFIEINKTNQAGLLNFEHEPEHNLAWVDS